MDGCFLTLAFPLKLLSGGLSRTFCWVNESLGWENKCHLAVSNLPGEGQLDFPSGPKGLPMSGWPNTGQQESFLIPLGRAPI